MTSKNDRIRYLEKKNKSDTDEKSNIPVENNVPNGVKQQGVKSAAQKKSTTLGHNSGGPSLLNTLTNDNKAQKLLADLVDA